MTLIGGTMAAAEDARKRSLEFEAVTRARLVYDMTLCATLHRTRLDVVRVGMDNAGYDVIADWERDRRYLQLKSKEFSSTTRHWWIWARLLKPGPDDWGANGIPSWQYFHPFGINGAVILTEMDFSSEPVRCRHYFTDVYILQLLAAGIIGHEDQMEPCGRLLRRLRSEGEFTYGHRVRLTKENFILVKDTTALIGLVGLPVRETVSWKLVFYRAFGQPSLVSRSFGQGPDVKVSQRLLSEIILDKCHPYGSDKWLPGS